MILPSLGGPTIEDIGFVANQLALGSEISLQVKELFVFFQQIISKFVSWNELRSELLRRGCDFGHHQGRQTDWNLLFNLFKYMFTYLNIWAMWTAKDIYWIRVHSLSLQNFFLWATIDIFFSVGGDCTPPASQRWFLHWVDHWALCSLLAPLGRTLEFVWFYQTDDVKSNLWMREARRSTSSILWLGWIWRPSIVAFGIWDIRSEWKPERQEKLMGKKVRHCSLEFCHLASGCPAQIRLPVPKVGAADTSSPWKN